MEDANGGSLTLQMTGNYTGAPALANYPWGKAMPVPPGSVLQPLVIVNGAPAALACAAATVNLLNAAGQTADYSADVEPPAVTVDANTCGVVYSVYKTPTLLMGTGSTGISPMSPAMNAPMYASPPAWSLDVSGSFLGNPYDRDVSVTVGGWSCVPTTDPPTVTVVNVSGSADTWISQARAAQKSGNGGTSVLRVSCFVPPLPWGTWPVGVQVAEYGSVRLAPDSSPVVPAVTYRLQVHSSGAWPPPTVGSERECQVGTFGRCSR